jgi:hypothetical protein
MAVIATDGRHANGNANHGQDASRAAPEQVLKDDGEKSHDLNFIQDRPM